ncbi:glycosyltransferase [Alteromonas sp. H39]|uniref:glycosyltransferase n=1 Tax=Alteromonas sp. H39 TaxID=3389876 RepID=UPI0039E16A3E
MAVKLIVQIPCYNEENTLPETVRDIPREIEGVDVVEVMIIDDGSSDRTVEVARELGVDHIVRNKNNRGLARTFRKGIDECLKLGADIIVNTDGDNQYAGWDIPKLIKPVVEGTADVVVGDRNTQGIGHFSPLKKLLQRVGSYVVKKVSGVEVPDAVSGFRAYSREAALQLNIISPFSYTIEALIQSGKKHMAVTHVPVETNAKTRESRLFTSIPKFIERQVTTIVRMYTMYQPLKVFVMLGGIITLIGLIPIVRFLIYYMMGEGDGHIQSLILGGVLALLGAITFLIAIIADLINFNRQLIEQTLEKVRRMELELLDYKKKQGADKE